MAANGNAATELDTFLPQDGSNAANGTKYKVAKGGGGGDAEVGAMVGSDFDPFKARNLEHPVSDCDTLTHLLKASLGTGILSMPAAFMNSGLALGIFGTIIVAAICTHCAYILVVCAHELYRRTGKTAMSFADVAEEACRTGPRWSRGFGLASKLIVLVSLFTTYFMTCSCYSVIIAQNFQQVAAHYMGEEPNLRICIAILLVPLILLSYVPNLKYLAPVSMVANLFMGVGLGITLYYLVIDIPDIGTRSLAASVTTLPVFVSITIFAIEAIGVVMPLENNMETPQNFLGLCGVLNQGMSGVTLVYILIGFMGYLKYGDETLGSITLNLPNQEYAAQAVKILIALAVYCTFGLQFYVCLDIAWNGVKKHFTKRPLLADYVMRTVLVSVAVIIAIAVPTIIPFVSLIGAFCFSILGLMCPIFIEVVTFWDKGFGRFHWKVAKNFLVIMVGILALIFGSRSAIEDIVALYSEQPGNGTLAETLLLSGSLNATNDLV